MLGPGSGTPVAGMLVMVGADTAAATAGLNTVSQQMNGVAKGGQAAGGALNSAMGLASAAVVGIGVASVKSAMTFEQSMRNVNSVAHLPEEQFQKLQDDVISFALTTRSSADNVAKSLYLVASAGLSLDEKVKSVAVQTKDGVVQMSEAMAVMQASSRAAGAGLADVDQVSKLLISTLRAYNMDAGQSGYVTDVFLKVVQSGLVTLPDLANVMGRLAPLAANLGVPIEEVGYAFAEMTQTGLSAEQAATRLNAIFTQMIKPSESLQQVIEKLGYTSGTQLIEKTGGVIPALKAITQTVFESTESIGGMTKAQTKMSLQYPFLVDQMDIYKQELAKIIEKDGEGSLAAQKKQLSMDKLNQKMSEYKAELDKTTPAQQRLVKEFYGTNEGIAELFRNVRAIGGVMALTTDETTMSAEAFAEWKAAIEGSVDAARAEQYKSLETQIKRLKVAFNVLGIEIGLTLIPPLTQLMDKVIVPLIRSFLPPLRAGLDAVQKAFESMPEPVQAVATALLALVFALKGARYTLQPLLGLFGVNVSALTALAGPLAIAAAAVVAFGVAYKNNLFGLKEATDKFTQGFKDGFAGFKTYMKDAAETGNLTVESLYKLPEPIQGAAYQLALFKQSIQAVVEDGHSLSEWLTEIDPLMNPVLAGIVSFVAAIGDVLSKGNDVLVENTQAMKDDISDFFRTGVSDFSGFRAAFEGISKIVSETFGLLFDNIIAWVKAKAPDLQNSFYQWAKNAIQWIGQAAAWMMPMLADWIGGLLNWIIGTGVPTLIGGGVLLVQGIIKGFSEGGAGANFMNSLMYEAIIPAMKGFENSFNEAGAIFAWKLHDGFSRALTTLFGQDKGEAIMASLEALQTRLEGIFGPTLDRIKASAKGFLDELALLKPKFEELGQAIMGLVGPASIIGQIIAGIVVVVTKVFGELVAQTIERLPEIIGGVVDFLTATVTTFTDVFMGIVDTIKAILAGDWAGAWESAKQTLADFVTGSAAQMAGLLVVVDNIVGGIYDSVVNTINDLTGATLPSWDQLKAGIVSKFEEIKAAVTGAIDEIKAKIDPIAAALQPVFDILSKVFEDIKTGFQEFLLELGPISLALAPIKEAVSGAFQGLKDALEVAKPALLWLKDALLTVSGIIVGLIGGSVMAVIVGFGEILSGIFRNAGTIIRGFGQVIAGVFDVIRSIFYSFISVVKSIFEGDMDGAAKAGLTAFEAFKEGIAGIFNGIGNIILGAFGAIYDTVTGIANKIPGVTLPAWEEVTRGFEFGASAIKGSTESASTALSTASTNMATAASTASTAVAGSLSNVAGSIDGARTSYTDFAGYTGTYMEQAAGSTQTYSDQMIAAFGNLPPAATTATSQVAAALSGVSTAAQTAQVDTNTATTSLIDGVLAKMNGLVGQVTGPQQTFADLQATVSKSSSVIQTDLDTMLAGWNSTFTEMATAPIAAGQTMAAGWQTGVGSLAPITTDALALTASAATTGFEAVRFSGDTALAALNVAATTQMDGLTATVTTGMGNTAQAATTGFDAVARAGTAALAALNTDASNQMATLNTTVATGLTALQTSYATNFTALQTQDAAYQSTASANLTAFYAGLTLQNTTYQTATTTALTAFYLAVSTQDQLYQTTTTALWTAYYLALSAQNLLYQTTETINLQLFVTNQLLAWNTMSIGVQGAALLMTTMVQARFAEFYLWLTNYLTVLLVPAVSLSFDSLYMIVVTQMAAMASAMQGGWLSMLGGTRSQMAAIRGEVNSQMSGMVSDVRGYAGQMEAAGSAVGHGLAAGIRSAIGAAIDAAVALVQAAIDAAWKAAQAASPSRIMMKLGGYFGEGFSLGVGGEAKGAALASAAVVSDAVEAAKSAAGIHSPSTEMQSVGWDFIMGLIKGIAAGDKEAIAKVTELMDKIMSTISNIVKALSDLATFTPQPMNLSGFTASIKAVIAEFKKLAEFFAGNGAGHGGLDSAKAVLDPLGEIFSKLSTVIQGITALLQSPVLTTGLADAQKASDMVVAIAKMLVIGFDAAAKQTKKVAWPAALLFAEVAGKIAEQVKAIADAVQAIANVAGLRIEDAAARLIWMAAGLVKWADWLGAQLGPDKLKKAGESADAIIKALSPWKAAADALSAIVAVAGQRIEDAAARLIWMTAQLIGWIDWINAELGSDKIKDVADKADAVVKALSPWKAAADAVSAVADVAGVRIEDAAARLTWMTAQLIEWVSWLENHLPAGLLEAAAARADMVVKAVSPWKAAADAVAAIAGVAGVRVEDAATRLVWMTEQLIGWVNWLENHLTPGVLEAAAARADMVVKALSPWKAAADAVKAVADVAGQRVEDAATRLIWMTEQLIRWVNWLEDYLRPGVLQAAAARADMVVKALSPWKAAGDAIKAIADAAGVRIEDAAKRMIWMTEGLIRWVDWLQSHLGPGLLQRAAAAAEFIVKALLPWKAAVETFTVMAGFIFRPIGPTAERIRWAIYGLARKLALLADGLGPDMIAQSEKGAAIMAAVLTPWKAAVETFIVMVNFVFRPIGPTAERIRWAVYGLARRLAFIATSLGPEMMASAESGAAIMATVLAPWDEAVKVLTVLAGFIFRPIGPAANKIVLSVAWLALKLAQVTNVLGPQIIGLAKEGAALFSAVLVPWDDAIKTLEAIADFVFKPIGPVADKIILTVAWLALKLAQVVLVLGPQIMALAGEGAALFSAILVPWDDATKTLEAMADFAFRPIGPVANKIMLSVAWLAVRLSQVVTTLGPETIALAKEGAAMFGDILAPWQDAVTTLTALAQYVARNVSETANSITDSVGILAKAMASMADKIGMDVLKKAAKVGALLSDVLAPWETAMKVADEMRAFRIMPDFVDKMVRFGRQWIEVVDQLGRILLLLNQDGLDAVEDFAAALTALTDGLISAMEIIQAGEWPTPDPATWDAFVAWVWGIFRTFYDLLDDFMADPGNVIGFDPVSQFATALEALLSSLTMALELAKNFAFVEPPASQWDGFIDWVWRIFQTFYNLLDDFMADPNNVIDFDPVSKFAAALEAILSSLTMALELARSFDFVEPPADLWDSFTGWVWRIFLTFYNLLDDFMADPNNVIDFDPVVKFGSALESIMGGLSAALEIARDFSFIEPPAGLWDAFVAWVWRVFQTFYNLLDDFMADPNNVIGFDPVESFGSALESLMGGLSAALELVTGFQFTPPNPAMWAGFVAWVILAFTTFYDYVQTFQTDPATALNFDPVESFGSALESLMGGLGAALDLVTGFQFTPPDPQMWANFIGWVQTVFDQLYDYIVTHYPMTVADAEAFAPVAAWGDALDSVMGGLATALEVFAGLTTFVAPLQSRIDAFLSAVEYTFTTISAFVVANITPAMTAAVSDFSGAMSDLMGGLQDALSLFENLANASDLTIDFIAGASSGSDTGAFQQRMGYLFAAIHETMVRFNAYVVQAAGTTWLPIANSFLDTLDTMIGVLQDALGLFVDLEGANLPTPERITEFVAAVLQLFSQLSAGLGINAGQIGGTAAGLGREFDLAVAGYQAGSPEWNAAGQALTGALQQGFASQTVALRLAADQVADMFAGLAYEIEVQALAYGAAAADLMGAILAAITAGTLNAALALLQVAQAFSIGLAPIQALGQSYYDTGTSLIGHLAAGLSGVAGLAAIAAGIADIAAAISSTSLFSDLDGTLWELGQMLVFNLAAGLGSQAAIAALTGAAAAIGALIIEIIEELLGIGSPSKEMLGIAANITTTLSSGVLSGQNDIAAAVTASLSPAIAAFDALPAAAASAWQSVGNAWRTDPVEFNSTLTSASVAAQYSTVERKEIVLRFEGDVEGTGLSSSQFDELKRELVYAIETLS